MRDELGWDESEREKFETKSSLFEILSELNLKNTYILLKRL
jgi:hypothetical protein